MTVPSDGSQSAADTGCGQRDHGPRRHHRHHVHRHHSHGAHTHRSNETAIGLAAPLTGGFMVAELIGGLISSSLALLADAGDVKGRR